MVTVHNKSKYHYTVEQFLDIYIFQR